MSKAVVLLSGGQDSTTCLYWAKQNFDEVKALSIMYGQRHIIELSAAQKITGMAGTPHTVIDAPYLATFGSAMTDRSVPIVECIDGLPSTNLPGRNIFLLLVAAQVAISWGGCFDIVGGMCQTDFSGYPDCRREFIDAMEVALDKGLGPNKIPISRTGRGGLTIHTPLMYQTKAESVLMAKRLPGCWNALALSVTCYRGEVPSCGECPACELRKAGFHQAGFTDPATEQDKWLTPVG